MKFHSLVLRRDTKIAKKNSIKKKERENLHYQILKCYKNITIKLDDSDTLIYQNTCLRGISNY